MSEKIYKCKFCGEEVGSKAIADTMSLIGTCFHSKNKRHEFKEIDNKSK